MWSIFRDTIRFRVGLESARVDGIQFVIKPSLRMQTTKVFGISMPFILCIEHKTMSIGLYGGIPRACRSNVIMWI